MVLQIGKCFKVFPNMAWHHKTPTTTNAQKPYKNHHGEGFSVVALFRYLQMCQHYAARWVQLHEVMRRSHPLYPGGGVEGVKIQMEEGLKLVGMLVISNLTSHSVCSLFGNWQFWMASTVDDKHEPKSQKKGIGLLQPVEMNLSVVDTSGSCRPTIGK